MIDWFTLPASTAPSATFSPPSFGYATDSLEFYTPVEMI